MAPQPRVTDGTTATCDDVPPCHVSRVTCGQCAGVPCPGGDVPRAGDHWQCGARPRHRPMVSVGDQPSWRLHTASTLHTSASASRHQHQPGHDTLPTPCEAQPVLEDNISVETVPASPENQAVDVVDIAKCPLGNKTSHCCGSFYSEIDKLFKQQEEDPSSSSRQINGQHGTLL